MKYLITEKQLKTLRKYMKTFVNEANMDSYIQGDNDPKAPWNRDEPSEEKKFSITYNNETIAEVEIDEYDYNVSFSTDFSDEDIETEIEDKLVELNDKNMLDELSNDNTIEYEDLMSM
jgi:hypothetical protein